MKPARPTDVRYSCARPTTTRPRWLVTVIASTNSRLASRSWLMTRTELARHEQALQDGRLPALGAGGLADADDRVGRERVGDDQLFLAALHRVAVGEVPRRRRRVRARRHRAARRRCRRAARRSRRPRRSRPSPRRTILAVASWPGRTPWCFAPAPRTAQRRRQLPAASVKTVILPVRATSLGLATMAMPPSWALPMGTPAQNHAEVTNSPFGTNGMVGAAQPRELSRHAVHGSGVLHDDDADDRRQHQHGGDEPAGGHHSTPAWCWLDVTVARRIAGLGLAQPRHGRRRRSTRALARSAHRPRSSPAIGRRCDDRGVDRQQRRLGPTSRRRLRRRTSVAVSNRLMPRARASHTTSWPTSRNARDIAVW